MSPRGRPARPFLPSPATPPAETLSPSRDLPGSGHRSSSILFADEVGCPRCRRRSCFSSSTFLEQYLFGLIGYAIGLGNVWRFCYVIARDGGAAALLAYMICFIFIATPLFMYEMLIGQYLALSALPAWVAIRPRWIGLGLSQFLMTFIVQS